MDAEGQPVEQPGDRFLLYMDQDALGDVPLGKYSVEVVITKLVADASATRSRCTTPSRTSSSSSAPVAEQLLLALKETGQSFAELKRAFHRQLAGRDIGLDAA